jgi:hypothetical protein
MTPSKPSVPPQLARQNSLSSAIADLKATSATAFDDPFSSDFEMFAKEFSADDSKMPALPSSFAIPNLLVYSLPSASTLNEITTPSSAASVSAITRAAHTSSNSSSESGTEELSDTTSHGTSLPPRRAGTTPRSRWTTQERSLFLATVAKLAHTLDTAIPADKRNLAETVSLVVGTKSAREVQSHARRALRKLRARAESKSVSSGIKTLIFIIGSSDHTG